MEKLKALIVEDTPMSADHMVSMLGKETKLEIVEKLFDVHNALAWLRRNSVDLIFVNIELKGSTALERTGANGVSPYSVIYITSLKRSFLKTISSSGSEYLLKPVRLNELENLINKMLRRPQMNGKTKKDNLFAEAKLKIRINTRTGFLLISLADILYCEADGNYSIIYYKDGRKEISTMNLGQIEAQIGHADFLRVSRSFLINTAYLYKVDRKDKICVLEANGKQVVLTLPDKSMRLIATIFDH